MHDEVVFTKPDRNGTSGKQYRTVLVIDDDPYMLSMLANLLNPDFLVWTAKDAHQGIELAIEHTPDVILLDVFMPHIDGLSTLLLLKSSPIIMGIPVVIMSSTSKKNTIVQLLKHGAVAFLLKPFTKDALVQKLTQAITPGTGIP